MAFGGTLQPKSPNITALHFHTLLSPFQVTAVLCETPEQVSESQCVVGISEVSILGGSEESRGVGQCPAETPQGAPTVTGWPLGIFPVTGSVINGTEG